MPQLCPPGHAGVKPPRAAFSAAGLAGHPERTGPAKGRPRNCSGAAQAARWRFVRLHGTGGLAPCRSHGGGNCSGAAQAARWRFVRLQGTGGLAPCRFLTGRCPLALWHWWSQWDKALAEPVAHLRHWPSQWHTQSTGRARGTLRRCRRQPSASSPPGLPRPVV